MKRKEYWFNDGMGGIVVAHSVKQAIKKLARNYYMWDRSQGRDTTKEEIKLFREIRFWIKFQKRNPDLDPADMNWDVYSQTCNDKGRSRLICYTE